MNSLTKYSWRTIVIAAALFVGACASPGPVPSQVQPALAKVAQPYAGGLRKVGITSVMVYGNGARVRTATRMGEVYFRYPSGLAPVEFALYVDAQGIEVDSDNFNSGNAGQYEAAMKAILPEVIRLATANNTMQMQQQMGGGGGGGR